MLCAFQYRCTVVSVPVTMLFPESSTPSCTPHPEPLVRSGAHRWVNGGRVLPSPRRLRRALAKPRMPIRYAGQPAAIAWIMLQVRCSDQHPFWNFILYCLSFVHPSSSSSSVSDTSRQRLTWSSYCKMCKSHINDVSRTKRIKNETIPADRNKGFCQGVRLRCVSIVSGPWALRERVWFRKHIRRKKHTCARTHVRETAHMYMLPCRVDAY